MLVNKISIFKVDFLLIIKSLSNSNNCDLNVTGILLYHEGSIAQVIEGEEQTLKALYGKIERDSRHRGIIKLSEGNLDPRNFPDWSMGFRTVGLQSSLKLPVTRM